MIASVYGGAGKLPENFVLMYQKANQWMYDHAENSVVEAIKGGGSVYVEAYPIYGNKKSTVPTAVQYLTSGSVQEECVIKNNATAAGSYCQQGMW